MARNGSGVYSAPAGTAAVSGDPVSSSKFNTLVDDLVNDANGPRPIVAGGTGASSASAARTKLGLGTAAIANVQASAADTTAGVALTPGAFGIGLTGASGVLVDIDDITQPSGLYTYDAGTIGTKPSGAETSGTVSWQKEAATGGAQTLVGTSGQTVFIRAASGGAWAGWRRLDTPAGAVQSFAMSTVPSGWLECNGQAISRTTFSVLFAAIGTTFGVGDGSTTFEVPDLRGEFVRGWDHGKGTDSGRTLGSSQSDEIKAHTHTQSGQSVNANGAAGSSIASAATYQLNSGTTASTGGDETRPRNIALMYCIKV